MILTRTTCGGSLLGDCRPWTIPSFTVTVAGLPLILDASKLYRIKRDERACIFTLRTRAGIYIQLY